jgi:predicted permease
MRFIFRELRLAIRRLRQSPGFTVAALLMLALGIGATVTIFSVVDGVLLKPLAYQDSQQLVNIREVVEEWRGLYPSVPANPMHFNRWRQRATAFSGWALLQMWKADLATGSGPAVMVPTAQVSIDFFSLLGVQPMLGRGFTPGEMQDGHDHVVVLSSRIWRERFGGDRQIVGKTIRMDGYPFTVAGVLPGKFELPSNNLGLLRQDEPDAVNLFVPLVISVDRLNANHFGDFNFQALARLKAGSSLQQATAQMNAIEADLARHLPDAHVHLSAQIIPLKETVVGGVSQGLWLLFAGVGCVLLIVCINLANLHLVRGILRSRETAVRAALGASRGDLLTHSLAESLVLAVVGGGLGFLLCSACLRLLPHILPGSLPRSADIKLDAPVLAFSLIATTLTVLLAGVLPGLRSISIDPQSVLQGGSRTAGSRHSARLRTALVGAEVLCSTALLLVAALLAKSFVRLMSVDRGFRTEHILTLRVALPRAQYQKDEPRNRFYDELSLRLSHLPGVESAGFSSVPLMHGETWTDGLTPLPAPQHVSAERQTMANIRWASPEFLSTMGIPVIAGRMFSEQDRGKQTVAVLSASAARKLWPGEDAVGRSFKDDEEHYTVAGVIADARSEDLSAAPIAIVYYPYWQSTPYFTSSFLALRTKQDPMALAAAVRGAITQLEPEAAITHVETMDEVVGASVAERQFEFHLLLAFAAVALLLAALGLYGVLSHSVAERTRELGVRIALGAPREALYRFVFRQAAVPVIAGVAGGLAVAWVSGRLIASLLFEVKPYDVPSALLVVLVLAVTVIAASYFPTRRAASVDPMQALRME